MTKYRLLKNGVKDVEACMSIPEDLENRHWRQYLAWASKGGVPDPEFTLEQLTANAVAEEVSGLKRELVNNRVFYLRIIIELFGLLKSHTDCTNDDMKPALLAKLQNMKVRTDRLQEIDK